MVITELPRTRGRPRKDVAAPNQTREALIRAGLAALTTKGFSATGIEEILKEVGVPKGSFYHYFASKEAFGAELIERYGAYFAGKLDRFLLDASVPPLERLRNFTEDAGRAMARFGYRRGCLVGNLGQEMSTLPESFRQQLTAVFQDWERRVADCLRAAQAAGEIGKRLDCAELASFFWIGWEGAILRSKLQVDTSPLRIFAEGFFGILSG